MHGVHIDTWLKQMSYWGTKANEPAVYALSDMLNVHSFIVTKNQPWTTVDASVNDGDTKPTSSQIVVFQ